MSAPQSERDITSHGFLASLTRETKFMLELMPCHSLGTGWENLLYLQVKHWLNLNGTTV